MHNAIPLTLAVLVSVGIIAIGYFYVASPQRISGGLDLGLLRQILTLQHGCVSRESGTSPSVW